MPLSCDTLLSLASRRMRTLVVRKVQVFLPWPKAPRRETSIWLWVQTWDEAESRGCMSDRLKSTRFISGSIVQQSMIIAFTILCVKSNETFTAMARSKCCCSSTGPIFSNFVPNCMKASMCFSLVILHILRFVIVGAFAPIHIRGAATRLDHAIILTWVILV